MPIRLKLPKPKRQWKYLIPEAEAPRFKKSGFTVGRRKSQGRVLVTKRKPAWEQFEEEILILFRHGLGLTDVDGGPALRIAGFQVDVIGGIRDSLLVVECKSKKEPGKKSLHSYIRSFWVKKRSITNSLRRLFGGHYKRTFFILALQGILPSDRDLAFAKKKKILVWSESYLESIRSLYLTIGDRAKYYILRELGGTPPLVPGGHGRNFMFPALEARTGGRDRLYSTFIPARILLDLAYVLRIESGQKKAYQRFLDKNRLFRIAKFIEDGNSFKNSIVLALDKRSRFSARPVRWGPGSSSDCRVGLLKIPRQFAYAWVIDGQHRLYGFARSEEKFIDHLLPVVALQTKSRSEEAKTFLDINSKQKPVDPSLLWALFGILYPNEIRGLVSDFVRFLATEPKSALCGKVFVPGESKQSRKHFRIFHSNLCDTFSDHFIDVIDGRSKGFPLLSGNDLAQARREEALSRAFKTVNLYVKWLGKQADKAGERRWIKDFFLTNNGLNVVLRVLVQILKHTDGKIDTGKLETLFGAALREYLTDNRDAIDQLRRQTSSEGTRETTAFGIIKALARKTEGFAGSYIKLHRQEREEQEPYKLLRSTEEILRQMISERLSALRENWWIERIPPDVREPAILRKEQDESPWPWMEGKQYPAYYYMSFSEYSKVISKRDNWREAFEDVFRDPEWVRVIFRELERTRNDVAHNRDLSERQLRYLRLYSEDIARAVAGAPKKAPIPTIPVHGPEQAVGA
ncbi:MAG TPA: DGQHR domain-containing protein [Candidatus Acidoferrum sp.]|nr:DGQHR domain-containing protein [Candidatus Acidoferrum sp.]